MAFNFRTMFYECDILVTDGRKIAKHYLTTWFIFDLLAFTPLDSIFIAVQPTSPASSLGRFPPLLRVLHLIQFAYLTRIVRRSLGPRIRHHFRLTRGTLHFFTRASLVLLVTHWAACLFHLTAVLEGDVETWVSVLTDVSASAADQYTVSLYWAVKTLTTIGYGDIVPVTTAERLVCILCQLVLAALFSWVIALFVQWVAKGEHPAPWEEKMRQFEVFSRQCNIPYHLHTQIEKFLRFSLQHKTSYNNTLRDMSLREREATVDFRFKAVMERVVLFQGVDIHFLSHLAMSMRPVVACDGEKLFREGDLCSGVYFALVGCVELVAHNRSVAVVHTGAAVGEDVFFSDTRVWASVVRGDSTLLELRCDDLRLSLAAFPDTADAVRHALLHRLWTAPYLDTLLVALQLKLSVSKSGSQLRVHESRRARNVPEGVLAVTLTELRTAIGSGFG